MYQCKLRLQCKARRWWERGKKRKDPGQRPPQCARKYSPAVGHSTVYCTPPHASHAWRTLDFITGQLPVNCAPLEFVLEITELMASSLNWLAAKFARLPRVLFHCNVFVLAINCCQMQSNRFLYLRKTWEINL